MEEWLSCLAMHARVVVNDGAADRREGRLRPGGYLVGRSRSCQIRPTDRSVSRRHCLLIHHGDSLSVMDLGSTSGTFINDQPIEAGIPSPLCDRDQLRLGNVAFTILISTTEPAASPKVKKKTSAIPLEVDTHAIDNDALDEESSGAEPISPMREQEVANWLTELDETDRQVRIENLRARANSQDEKDSILDEPLDTIPEPAETTVKESSAKRPESPAANSKKSSATKNTNRINQLIQLANDYPQLILLVVSGLLLLLVLSWSLYSFLAPDPSNTVVPGI